MWRGPENLPQKYFVENCACGEQYCEQHCGEQYCGHHCGEQYYEHHCGEQYCEHHCGEHGALYNHRVSNDPVGHLPLSSNKVSFCSPSVYVYVYATLLRHGNSGGLGDGQHHADFTYFL